MIQKETDTMSPVRSLTCVCSDQCYWFSKKLTVEGDDMLLLNKDSSTLTG